MAQPAQTPEFVVPESDLTEYVLARQPDKAAVIDGVTGDVLTYSRLDERSRQFALGLRKVAPPGGVLALIGHNQPAWVPAFHGALRAGLAVTPVNPLLTADEMAKQLGATRAGVVVTATPAEATARAAADRAGIRHVYTLDDVPSSSTGSLVPIGPDAIAVMPSTSGTTGHPKIALLTHRNLVANLAQHQAISPVTERDVFCATIPFCHMYGLSLVLNAALLGGATVVTLPRFDLTTYLDVLHRRGVTLGHFAPPMVAALAGAPGPARYTLPALRGALCGAAPVDLTMLARAEQRLGCPIRQGYGMTEAGPGTHLTRASEFDRTPAGSVGRPVPGTNYRLVDPRTGKDVPDGQPGELWISGPQVMRGYLGDGQAAVHDGWLRTGDLVRVDEDGFHWVVDRLKDLIKYKGHQVAPAELESLLRTHPDVQDAGVVGVPDPVAGERPHAFVIRRGDVTAEELLTWAAARVAPFKRIRSAEFVDSLPVTPAGKLSRGRLRANVRQ